MGGISLRFCVACFHHGSYSHILKWLKTRVVYHWHSVLLVSIMALIFTALMIKNKGGISLRFCVACFHLCSYSHILKCWMTWVIYHWDSVLLVSIIALIVLASMMNDMCDLKMMNDIYDDTDISLRFFVAFFPSGSGDSGRDSRSKEWSAEDLSSRWRVSIPSLDLIYSWWVTVSPNPSNRLKVDQISIYWYTCIFFC